MEWKVNSIVIAIHASRNHYDPASISYVLCDVDRLPNRLIVWHYSNCCRCNYQECIIDCQIFEWLWTVEYSWFWLATSSCYGWGWGMAWGFGNNKPQCELCGKFGQLFYKCYQRFNVHFQGLILIQMIVWVPICPQFSGMMKMRCLTPILDLQISNTTRLMPLVLKIMSLVPQTTMLLVLSTYLVILNLFTILSYLPRIPNFNCIHSCLLCLPCPLFLHPLHLQVKFTMPCHM